MKRLFTILAMTSAILVGDRLFAEEQVGVEERSVQEADGHFAEINGMRMYYEMHGEGEPLVMLHGFTGSSAKWIIPNGGHVPIFGRNKTTFAEKALEFLSGDWQKQNESR